MVNLVEVIAAILGAIVGVLVKMLVDEKRKKKLIITILEIIRQETNIEAVRKAAESALEVLKPSRKQSA